MPKRISNLLNVEPYLLEKKGVFNSFVDIDSKLYIDPSLLEVSTINEFKNSYKKFEEYFDNIFPILASISSVGDRAWREAKKRLTFRERHLIQLGFAKKGSHGKGIGPQLAQILVETCSDLVKKGINNTKLFELIGVFEDGIGPDRISDMTSIIIMDELISYTERVCQELKINTIKTIYGTKEIFLPYNTYKKRPMLFIPMELLRNIPIAYDWSDFDRVCRYNQELRDEVNDIIGSTWKKATKNISKSNLKNTILKYPDLLNDLISQYEDKDKIPYDFENDPAGEIKWGELVEFAVNKFPLSFNQFLPITNKSIFDIVLSICNKFKDLIENNGWFEYLYDPNDKSKTLNERFPQKLFYGIADSYCEARNLDISRESNGGVGPVDFKISKGYNAKVTVEVKYAHNTHLIEGYKKQLPAYNRAEKSTYSIYLVIKTRDKNPNLGKLTDLKNKQTSIGNRVPDIFIIDGTWQKSASKR
ncbi:MAG: hypothetical protein ABSG15_14225 [FCB group bacterium]|jgi:hypothetical protein